MKIHFLVVLLANFVVFGHSIELSCDFDQPFTDRVCDYRPFDNTTTDAWSTITLNGPRQNAALDGPLNQVTPGSFLQLDGNTGRLTTESTFLEGPYCLSLDYYLVSSEVATIGIFARNLDEDTEHLVDDDYHDFALFFRNTNSSRIDEWQHYVKTVKFRPANYEIHLVARSDSPNQVAIDNLLFFEGPCPEPVSPGVRACDFDGIQENGRDSRFSYDLDCDWLSSVDPVDPWFVRHPRLGNSFTDSTTGSRHGGLLNTGMIGATPDALHFNISATEGRHCLSFAIRQHASAREWKVVEKAIESGVENVLWTSVPADDIHFDSPLWRFKQFNIDPVVDMTITIDATLSQLFIDDVKLVKGLCRKPVDCSFEDGLCGWTTTSIEENWLIGQGRVVNPDDQLIANYEDEVHNEVNKYLYVDLKAEEGVISMPSATVESELLASGRFCARFETTTSAQTIFMLKVNSGDNSLTSRTVLHEVLNNTNNVWQTWVADVKAIEESRLVVSVSTLVPRSVFKLRNFSIHKGTCEENRRGEVPEETFGEVNFHCYQTGHQIPQYRSCDGVIDCPMGEDEGEQCQSRNCTQSGIPCQVRRHRFCLTNTNLFCNGVADCQDGSDEDTRLCNRDQFCANFCVNDGQCSRDPEEYSCDCKPRTSGKRCQIEN